MAEPPAHEIDEGAIYRATVHTDRGAIVMELDPQMAPKSVNNFVSLARQGYYDGLTFHRVVPEFVIQGGDPDGTGRGGPGYRFADEPVRGEYTLGAVAMAKTGAEKPGTAGSQFFVVTGANAGLPADYALLGKVVSGLDVVKRIGQLGDQSEQPTFNVVIQDVKVS